MFVIGIDLIDIAGLRQVWAARRSEFYIAALTAVVVFAVGVEQGIILAVVLSLLEMVRRQYRPHRFVVGILRTALRPTPLPSRESKAPGAARLPL